ncbi:O-methyltransferase [Streptomyces lucensis]|uniref:O-methyltransferase n=1 Tax=Streptomyces lucensis TaxID=67319 RepID=UPI001E4951A7|nr:class I SAM-dependent methyltransferase [Streptomyces lucensis]
MESVLERLDRVNVDSFKEAVVSGAWSADPFALARLPLSVSAEIGDLVYLTARAARVTRAVDFATSVGTSLICLAAAVRDNGGGLVIGSELVPEKVDAARRNVAAAGLGEYVEIREGDARETLADVGGPVDFAIVDGFQATDSSWTAEGGTSLALDVLRLLVPQLRSGAVVVNDNGEPDYLAYVRDPVNGFRSSWIPLLPRHAREARGPLADGMGRLPADAGLMALMPEVPGLELSVRC